MARKFYRTVIQVTVLSEEPYDTLDLSQIAYDTDQGDCVGDVAIVKEEEVDGKRMAELLVAAGSEAAFFQLDDNGEDCDP